MAGGALNHRKPRPAPISAPQQHREFAGAGDEMDLQVFGEHRVADEIGDQAEARRRDHHRHDGQAVEPVGEVHRIARADDDEHAEQEEDPAEIEHQLLEERQRQRGRDQRLAETHAAPCTATTAISELGQQPHAAGKAALVLLVTLR